MNTQNTQELLDAGYCNHVTIDTTPRKRDANWDLGYRAIVKLNDGEKKYYRENEIDSAIDFATENGLLVSAVLEFTDMYA